MEQVDLIGQTSEFARVFGIEFYHVLSRGTQVNNVCVCVCVCVIWGQFNSGIGIDGQF